MTSLPFSGAGATNHAREFRPNGSPERLEIIFVIDGEQIAFGRASLLEPEFVSELRARAIGAASCHIHATEILNLDTPQRQTLVSLVVDVTRGTSSTQLSLRCNESCADFLQAARTLLQNCHPDQIMTATDLFIEIVAITQGDTGIRITCRQLVDSLRSRGVTGLRATQLVDQALEFRDQHQRMRHQQNRELIRDIWSDAGCREALLVPRGWQLASGEVVSNDGTDVIPCRILIARIFEAIEEQEFSVELKWSRGDHWLTRVCSREQISSTPSIVKLANFGLPVTANNASSFIQYLSDFEQDNLELLPCSQVASRMGWFECESGPVFLCGRRLIKESGGSEDDGARRSLTFHGADDGDERIAAGIQPGGTLARWQAAIETISSCPAALLALYSSLAAPLLQIVSAPNFIVSFDGRTSAGKTTALMVAASCWGSPVINGSDFSPAIRSWDTTAVYIERAAALSNGIPTIVDDTKVARRSEDVISTVYKIANGAGRGRGTIQGLAPTQNIQTILISSGEDPITSFSRAGGSRARVLAIWGSPFAEHPNAAQAVVHLRDEISEHFGHAGPAFVQYLIDSQEHWAEWREWYRDARRRYEQLTPGNAVASRMAACGALLDLAGHLAHRAVQFSFPYRETIATLWPMLTADTDEANQGLAAMRFFISWAESMRHRFLGAPSALSETPPGGWLGRWRSVARNEDEECLTIFPHVLDETLDQQGYPGESVRRHWHENGWLRTTSGKTTLRVSIGDSKCLMVAIRWTVIDQLMEGTTQMWDRTSREI